MSRRDGRPRRFTPRDDDVTRVAPDSLYVIKYFSVKRQRPPPPEHSPRGIADPRHLQGVPQRRPRPDVWSRNRRARRSHFAPKLVRLSRATRSKYDPGRAVCIAPRADAHHQRRPSLVAESFAAHCPLALIAHAFYPVAVLLAPESVLKDAIWATPC
jgi:hypothetical protein